MKDTIQIITLPPSRWREYKTLRLHAIMQDPYAFERTYDEDAALPDSAWKQSLRDAQEGKSRYLLFAEHSGILVGMAEALVEDNKITQHRARVISVYVLLEAQKKSLGKMLMTALLEKLEQDKRITLATLLVNEQQLDAIKLYEAAGFKSIGTIEQALCFNGECHNSALMTKVLKITTP